MKLKGNFTQIPNKIIESLIRARLGGTEEGWKVEFRGSHLGVTSNQQDTRPSDREETSSSDLGDSQEINKEKKERVEKIKKQIRERHAFLRNGNHG